MEKNVLGLTLDDLFSELEVSQAAQQHTSEGGLEKERKVCLSREEAEKQMGDAGLVRNLQKVRMEGKKVKYDDVTFSSTLSLLDCSNKALQCKNYNPNHAMWLAYCSVLAYREPEQVCFVASHVWGWHHAQFFNDEATDTQAFAMYNNTAIIVAFRGTESSRDWLTNLKFIMERPWRGTLKEVGVHSGFNTAGRSVYGQVREFILSAKCHNKHLPLFLTGHSLGGALANLLFAYLTFDPQPVKVDGLYAGFIG